MKSSLFLISLPTAVATVPNLNRLRPAREFTAEEFNQHAKTVEVKEKAPPTAFVVTASGETKPQDIGIAEYHRDSIKGIEEISAQFEDAKKTFKALQVGDPLDNAQGRRDTAELIKQMTPGPKTDAALNQQGPNPEVPANQTQVEQTAPPPTAPADSNTPPTPPAADAAKSDAQATTTTAAAATADAAPAADAAQAPQAQAQAQAPASSNTPASDAAPTPAADSAQAPAASASGEATSNTAQAPAADTATSTAQAPDTTTQAPADATPPAAAIAEAPAATPASLMEEDPPSSAEAAPTEDTKSANNQPTTDSNAADTTPATDQAGQEVQDTNREKSTASTDTSGANQISKILDETAEEQDALKIPTKSSKLDDALEEDRKTHDRALQDQQNAREQMMAEKQERDEAQRKNIDEDAKGVNTPSNIKELADAETARMHDVVMMSTSLISDDGNDAPNPIERVLQKRGIGEVEAEQKAQEAEDNLTPHQKALREANAKGRMQADRRIEIEQRSLHLDPSALAQSGGEPLLAPYDGGNARVADDEVDADAQNVTLKSKPVYTPEWFKDVIKAEHKGQFAGAPADVESEDHPAEKESTPTVAENMDEMNSGNDQREDPAAITHEVQRPEDKADDKALGSHTRAWKAVVDKVPGMKEIVNIDEE